MELTDQRQNDDEGLMDLADLDTNLETPAGWSPQQDELPFNARDMDDDADG